MLSSAYNFVLFLNVSEKSFIKTMKISGPRTDLRGNPLFTKLQFETPLPITILKKNGKNK